MQAPTLTIGAIKVDDDKATAEVNSAAQGQPPSRDTLQLERVGDSLADCVIALSSYLRIMMRSR